MVASGACSSRPPATSAPTTPAALADGTGAPLAAPAAASGAGAPRERPELRQHFDAEGVVGVIALHDSADGSLSCSDVARCTSAVLPASTFKIPNSMIALETGVVEDAETLLPWNGQQYPVQDWNQDLTLRAALRVSCVPCFQAIARSIGAERMQAWVRRIDFGNADTSGDVESFWLSGKLRISPLQQLDFLRRFDAGRLPVQERTTEIVRDMITLDVGRDHVLRGKSGLLGSPPQALTLAWFVGWLELAERRVFFATLIDQVSPEVDILPARRRVTERVLRALSLLPSDAARVPSGPN